MSPEALADARYLKSLVLPEQHGPSRGYPSLYIRLMTLPTPVLRLCSESMYPNLEGRKLLRRLTLLTTAVLMLVLGLPTLAIAQEGPTTADLSLAMDTMWVILAAGLGLFLGGRGAWGGG